MRPKLFGPRDLSKPQPEPEAEGLPARDKPAHEYTDEEWAATKAHTQRAVRIQEHLEREEQERLTEEQNRTPEEQHADALLGILGPDRKRQANEALIRSLHPGGEGDSEA